MIVNAAIFTCSICGEASNNICAYCTKDACSNHRCERCKRCSDCCECEVPLSAEEPVAMEVAAEAVAEPAAIVPEAVEFPVAEEPEPKTFTLDKPSPEAVVLEAPASETSVPEPPAAEPRFPVYLTAAESSVFVAGSVLSEPPETPDVDGADDQEPGKPPA
jgi:hypothetical protein